MDVKPTGYSNSPANTFAFLLTLLVFFLAGCGSNTQDNPLLEVPSPEPLPVEEDAPLIVIVPTLTPVPTPQATIIHAQVQPTANNEAIAILPSATLQPTTEPTIEQLPTVTPQPEAQFKPLPASGPIIASVPLNNGDYFRLVGNLEKPSSFITIEWFVNGVNNVVVERLGGEWDEAAKTWTVGGGGSIEQTLGPTVGGWPVTYNLFQSGSTSPLYTFEITPPCEYAWVMSFAFAGGPCPNRPIYSDAFQQNFENGVMVWIEEQDIVLYSDWSGTSHGIIDDTFRLSDDPIEDPNIIAPRGRFQPQYGIGKVWRETPGVRDLLGWAIDQGENYPLTRQGEPPHRYDYVDYVTLTDGGYIKLTLPNANWEVAYSVPDVVEIPPEPTPTVAIADARIDFFTTDAANANPGETISLQWSASGVEQLTLTTMFRNSSFDGSFDEVVAASGRTLITVSEAWRDQVTFVLRSDSADIESILEVSVNCPYEWFFSPNDGSCPSEPIVTFGAYQTFESGFMVWLQDLDKIIALTSNGVQNWDLRDTFEHGVHPIDDPDIIPPDGLFQPQYGFGKVWREEPGVRDALGWAIDTGGNYTVVLQCSAFSRGNKCYLRLHQGWVVESSEDPIWVIHRDWDGYASPTDGYR